MIAVLIAILLTCCCAAFGRTVVDKFAKGDALPAGERFAASIAVGLAIAGFLILALGLAGALSKAPVAGVFVLLAAVGWKGAVQNIADTRSGIGSLRAALGQDKSKADKLIIVLSLAGLAVFGLSAVIACFKPPGGFEWDAISYHLADPAQFILKHRIFSMPAEHHSNFPLLIEMLFTAGLLFQGYALANLMHLVCAVACIAGVFSFVSSRFGLRYAALSALLLASTPVLFWESTVGYVEMGLSMFTTLSTLALVRAVCPTNEAEKAGKNGLLMLSGLLMGFALGVKYLALVPAAILVVACLLTSRSVKSALAVAAIAAVVAFPWYAKNAVLTHNPVYPYFFKVFSGSKYWSADRAAGYEAEQQRFGQEHSLKNPPVFIRNLMQAPWDLVTIPHIYSNGGEFTFLATIGGLYAGLNGLLVLRKRMRKDIAMLLWVALAQAGAWFVVAQVGRYLLNVLPLLAITGVAALWALEQRTKSDKQPVTASGAVPILAQVFIMLQATGSLMVLYAAEIPLTATNIPTTLATIKSDADIKAYLTRHLDNYAVMQYLNANTKPDEGVALYDDTRGFYLNRPYIWANEAHSSYIPYAEFADGAELTTWMNAHGYRYAVINMNYAPQAQQGPTKDPDIPTPVGNEVQAFQKWVATEPLLPVGYAGYRFRGLIGDAIRRGLWTDMGEEKHGVILLRIGPDRSLGMSTGKGKGRG